MSSANTIPSLPIPRRGEPTWDMALMFPRQGGWSARDYLNLDAGMLVEFTSGFVRVLPMPTVLHQLIVQMLYRLLHEHVARNQLGEVLLAPLPVELSADKYREPDIVFARTERIQSLRGHLVGADLVMEVVSEGQESRHRDYVEKRQEYAAAGIPEYWIVDPQEKTILVLVLEGDHYCEQGVFAADATATSKLLPGFEVAVRTVFAKCETER